MEQVMQALKLLRKALHLSQRELSERIDCSRLSVTYWETNQTLPKQYLLERWLKALSDAVLEVRVNEKKGNKRLPYGAIRRSRMTKEELRRYRTG
jgi:transcriptional regulator with XRE-family HTH domain